MACGGVCRAARRARPRRTPANLRVRRMAGQGYHPAASRSPWPPRGPGHRPPPPSAGSVDPVLEPAGMLGKVTRPSGVGASTLPPRRRREARTGGSMARVSPLALEDRVKADRQLDQRVAQLLRVAGRALAAEPQHLTCRRRLLGDGGRRGCGRRRRGCPLRAALDGLLQIDRRAWPARPPRVGGGRGEPAGAAAALRAEHLAQDVAEVDVVELLSAAASCTRLPPWLERVCRHRLPPGVAAEESRMAVGAGSRRRRTSCASSSSPSEIEGAEMRLNSLPRLPCFLGWRRLILLGGLRKHVAAHRRWPCANILVPDRDPSPRIAPSAAERLAGFKPTRSQPAQSSLRCRVSRE